MLSIIMTLFSLAAILGVMLIFYVLTDKQLPKGVVFIHGFIATLALLLLMIFTFFPYPVSPLLSMILFIMAALGGFLFVYRDIYGKSMPKMAGHFTWTYSDLWVRVFTWILFFYGLINSPREN